ncbi:glypican-5-like isoform X1, partial [Lates japonicus]
MQTVDHCKVLSAGQTGFSPHHHSSSVQEKTPDLCCEALSLIPTNNVKIRRKPVIFAVNVIDVDAYSCHEVRTAFQLRQVGPLHRVPETPGTDVDLLICKHQGPSCCTRKMEESYQFAVKRETLHNIHSYSYELEHLISGHSDAFQ